MLKTALFIALCFICCLPGRSIAQEGSAPASPAAPVELTVMRPLDPAYTRQDTAQAPQGKAKPASKSSTRRRSVENVLIFIGGVALLIFLAP